MLFIIHKEMCVVYGSKISLRCSVCGHVWHHYSEEEILIEEKCDWCEIENMEEVASSFDEAEVEIDHQEDLIDWWLLRGE